jgi:hypothetical protein
VRTLQLSTPNHSCHCIAAWLGSDSKTQPGGVLAKAGPNHGVQATAYSVRSCVAPASSRA